MGKRGSLERTAPGQPEKMMCLPQNAQAPPSPLSLSACACLEFHLRKGDRPRWVNHPGWRFSCPGGEDTENLFSAPPVTPAIPGEGVRDSS